MSDDMKLLLVGAGIALFSTIISSLAGGIITYFFENRKTKRELTTRLYYLSGQLTNMRFKLDRVEKKASEEHSDERLLWLQEQVKTIRTFLGKSDSNMHSLMIGYYEANFEDLNKIIERAEEAVGLYKPKEETEEEE